MLKNEIIIAAQYKVHPDIWGGMDDFFEEMCSRLNGEGINAVIALPRREGSDPSHYIQRGIPHVMIDTPLFVDGLASYCKLNPCKIIHTHFLPTLTRYYKKLGISANAIITTEHMSRPYAGWTRFKKLRSKASAYLGAGPVSTMVHVSKYLENENKALFGNIITTKSRVIYNGVRIKPFSKEYVQEINPNRKLRLVSAGRLVFEKGFSDLIVIVKYLINKYGDIVQLDILGDGPLRQQLQGQAGEYLNKNIYFRGYVNDVPRRFRDSDLYVHCASQEAFAFVFLEAGEAGLPMITYDVGGNREAIIDGFNGFLAQAHDIENFVSRVGYFIDDASRIERFGRNARALVEASFSIDKMADKYLALYQPYL